MKKNPLGGIYYIFYSVLPRPQTWPPLLPIRDRTVKKSDGHVGIVVRIEYVRGKYIRSRAWLSQREVFKEHSRYR